MHCNGASNDHQSWVQIVLVFNKDMHLRKTVLSCVVTRFLADVLQGERRGGKGGLPALIMPAMARSSVRIKDQIRIQISYFLICRLLPTVASRGKGSCGNHLLRWTEWWLQMRIDGKLTSLHSLNSSWDQVPASIVLCVFVSGSFAWRRLGILAFLFVLYFSFTAARI